MRHIHSSPEETKAGFEDAKSFYRQLLKPQVLPFIFEVISTLEKRLQQQQQPSHFGTL